MKHGWEGGYGRKYHYAPKSLYMKIHEIVKFKYNFKNIFKDGNYVFCVKKLPILLKCKIPPNLVPFNFFLTICSSLQSIATANLLF